MPKDRTHAVVVGQVLGRVLTSGENDTFVEVCALRQGYGVIELAPDAAALLERHGTAAPFQDDENTRRLVDAGVLLAFAATERIDTEGLRVLASGSADGLDDATVSFRLRGPGGRTTNVSETVYWTWAYSTTSASVRQAAQIVAQLLPGRSAEDIVTEFEVALPALVLASCVTLDRALEND